MEEKIETPVTETSEIKEDEDLLDLPEPEKVDITSDPSKSYDEVIEEARGVLMAAYKKSRTLSNIMMFIVLATAVGSMILITQTEMLMKIIGWVIIGAVVVGMIVFYALTKNKFPTMTKEYIKTVNQSLNGRNFSDTQFEEVTCDPNERIELGDLVSDGTYKGVQIGSRNVINCKYSKRTLTVADVALYKATQGMKQQKQTAFVGKYLSYPNDLHFEGRIIINLKNKDEKYDQPDDISDLAVILDEETKSVYAKEGTELNSVLGSEFVSKINKIEIKDALLNTCVVIWGGHTAVYLSYTDDVMALPFEKAFNKEANEQYRSNLLEVLSALALLKK